MLVTEQVVCTGIVLLVVIVGAALQSATRRAYARGMTEATRQRNVELALQEIAQDARLARAVLAPFGGDQLTLQMPLLQIDPFTRLLTPVLPLQNGAVVSYSLDSAGRLVRTEDGVARVTQFRLSRLLFEYPGNGLASVSITAEGVSCTEAAKVATEEVFLQNKDL
jgi:hypothetical protein